MMGGDEVMEQDVYGEAAMENSGNVKVPRIPLNARIWKGNKEKPDFLRVFELYTDDYFIGLSEISRDLYFVDRYENFIYEKEGNTPHLLSVCMHHVDTLPEEDRDLFLYYTLIEPFAKIPAFERSKDK